MVYVLFFLAAAVFTLPVIWMNNNELIMAEKGWEARIRCMLKPRKNLIASAILGVGAGTGLAVISYLVYDDTFLYTLKLLFVYVWLISIAYIDGKTQRIPNKWILYGMAAWVVFYVIEGLMGFGWMPLLGQALLGVLMGGGVFLISAVVSKGGMGMGDVKLYTVLGLMVGWQGVFNLILISLVGSVVYGLVMIASQKMDRKSLIPMGPFTYIAMIVAILLGI
ncbi:MAG: prepilin peptidase [Lachnospiraceae bacterium]|nr:prepilin peptidase [Lachnospiraceae bacterium]